MPLPISAAAPTLFIRREAFEKAGLTRALLDERLGLTEEEFHVEGGLVAVGPLHGEDALTGLVDELEGIGLAYFDDFFELSGNWPDWLQLYAMSR